MATASLTLDTGTLTQDEEQLAGLSNLEMHNTKDDSSLTPLLMVNARVKMKSDLDHKHLLLYEHAMIISPSESNACACLSWHIYIFDLAGTYMTHANCFKLVTFICTCTTYVSMGRMTIITAKLSWMATKCRLLIL